MRIYFSKREVNYSYSTLFATPKNKRPATIATSSGSRKFGTQLRMLSYSLAHVPEVGSRGSGGQTKRARTSGSAHQLVAGTSKYLWNGRVENVCKRFHHSFNKSNGG